MFGLMIQWDNDISHGKRIWIYEILCDS